MDVNANFVGELLELIQSVLQDSYSLEFRNGFASLLIHFPPISLYEKRNKELSGLQTKLMPR